MKNLYLNLAISYRAWKLKRTLRELARLTLLTRGTTETETVTTIDVRVAPAPEPKPKLTNEEIAGVIAAEMFNA